MTRVPPPNMFFFVARLPSILRSFAFALLALACGASFAATSEAPGERRLALVIGNGGYRIGALANAVNDAHQVSAALRQLGFEVIEKENLDLAGMLDQVRAFTLKAKDYDVRLFYYAGHGLQVKGRNYLVPLSAPGTMTEDDVPSRTFDMGELVERLPARGGLNLVILDACRSNPFQSTAIVGPDGRSIRIRGAGQQKGGLAQIDAAQGSIIAYSTAPGKVAVDGGNTAGNGVYTKHLVAQMLVPGQTVEQMFKRVRNAVVRETDGQQVPWESSSLVGDFCFRSAPGGACAGGSDAPNIVPVAATGS